MAFNAASPNLISGKGIGFFAPHANDNPTAVANGFRDLGNAPSLSFGIATEKVEHFSSRGGVRQLDASFTSQVNRSGSMTLETVNRENLALFFLGSSALVTTASATSQSQTFTNVEKDRVYQLGLNVLDMGARKVSNVSIVTVTGSTALVAGTDYYLDADRGLVQLLLGGTVVTDANKAAGITVTYDRASYTRSRVLSGSNEAVGSMFFRADNPQGEDIDFLLPFVKLRPNGEFNLISDEFLQMEFAIEAFPLGDLAAIMANGQPY